MSSNKEKGAFGESAACAHLEASGYTVKERNYHTRHGEIDILAENGVNIVFCEVKTRSAASAQTFGRPAAAVGAKKQELVAAAAKEYLFYNPSALSPRFDVIEVYISSHAGAGYKTEKITHIENAFYASSAVRFGSRDKRPV